MDRRSSYDIPVIGLVFQFVGYLDRGPAGHRPDHPRGGGADRASRALCGVMCERSGVVNIGIEGTMLIAAFVGWSAGVFLAADPGPSDAGPSSASRRRCSSRSLLAVLAAVARLARSTPGCRSSVRADQIISGTIINIAAFGLTGYLNTLLIAPELADGRRRVHGTSTPPAVLDRPAARRLALHDALRPGPDHDLAPVRRRSSSRSCCSGRAGACARRAVGEHPRAAETVGIDVIRLRYRNVIVGGVLAGLGGAFLTHGGDRVVPAGDDRPAAGSSAWPR